MEKDKIIQMTERHLKKTMYALEHNYNRNGITKQEKENLVNNVKYYRYILDLIQGTEVPETNQSLAFEEIIENFIKKPIWDNEFKEWIFIEFDCNEELGYCIFGDEGFWKFEFEENRYFKNETKEGKECYEA